MSNLRLIKFEKPDSMFKSMGRIILALGLLTVCVIPFLIIKLYRKVI